LIQKFIQDFGLKIGACLKSKEKTMKVYVTKYALTRGILLMEVKETGTNIVCESTSWNNYFHEGEWFES